ncbi:MAG: acyl-CoA synthetase FdrA [Anaerolineales bacterium]|nr:acyl-CoA synthetase FdrA [Anaerolineales bacterium]
MMISKVEIRSGAYYDSVILMQLQRELAALPEVIDAGVVMGTEANKNILNQNNMLSPEGQAAGPEDLLIVVQAQSEEVALNALRQVDELLTRRRQVADYEYRPKSIETAAEMAPDARWALISVPGRYAADVTRTVLNLEKNVFLYSDNVTLEDEIAIKQAAREKGLMVMGPDCGTAIVNGVGLGFANQVRRGPIGLVAASGTGLQAVSVRIHQLGSGITHAIGTGGRDLSDAVEAITAYQGLDLLRRDPDTQVIVLISKPPSAVVAEKLVHAARLSGKPVVVDFIGYASPSRRVENVFYTTSFDETAELAVELASASSEAASSTEVDASTFSSTQRYLRGLFSGGTLAYETLLILQAYIPGVYSNVPLKEELRLPDALISQGHTIVDLGEDEFTVGRLHPMMDNDLRIRRLEQEASDPEVAVLLLDVVLGHGAHPDPASEIAPVIQSVIARAQEAGRQLEVLVVVVGTNEDPQGLDGQISQLEAAGAKVWTSNEAAARYVGRLVQALSPEPEIHERMPVNLSVLKDSLSAINVGVESFSESLSAQGASVIHVDWRPPAGGNQELMSILERMKGK